jgi:hypothetical protein
MQDKPAEEFALFFFGKRHQVGEPQKMRPTQEESIIAVEEGIEGIFATHLRKKNRGALTRMFDNASLFYLTILACCCR